MKNFFMSRYFWLAVGFSVIIAALVFVLSPVNLYTFAIIVYITFAFDVACFSFCIVGVFALQRSKLNFSKLPNWPLILSLIAIFLLFGGFDLHQSIEEWNKLTHNLIIDFIKVDKHFFALLYLCLKLLLNNIEKVLIFVVICAIYYASLGVLLLLIKRLTPARD